MIRLSGTIDQGVGKKRQWYEMDCGREGGAASHTTGDTNADIQMGMNDMSSAQSLGAEFRQMLDTQKLQNNEFAGVLQEFKNVLNEIKQNLVKIEDPDSVKFNYYA